MEGDSEIRALCDDDDDDEVDLHQTGVNLKSWR